MTHAPIYELASFFLALAALAGAMAAFLVALAALLFVILSLLDLARNRKERPCAG